MVPWEAASPCSPTSSRASRSGCAATKSEIVFVTPTDERTKDDPQVRRPDITKARTVLGWEPQVSVEEGISRTIDYFRERFAAEG